MPVASTAIGIDQAFGRELAASCASAAARSSRSGTMPAPTAACSTSSRHSAAAVCGSPRVAGRRTVALRLTGPHNALNVAAALALADVLGLDPDLAASAIEATAALPGRFERLAADAGYDVIVDYAHNPDGVEQALGAARAVLEARGRGALRVVLSTL